MSAENIDNPDNSGINNIREFTKGLIKENPIFVIMLGLCPTLGTTTMIANGIGMGVATTFVLICSNILISILKDYIPDKVRIPAYIVIIATFVTIIDLLIKAFFPVLADTLGVFIPLIVVNCIILGRAEAFASKNTVVPSIFDALGMGLGFTGALIIISFFREVFGKWAIDFTSFGAKDVWNLPFGNGGIVTFGNIEVYSGAMILVLPAGAFFVLGLILAFISAIKNKKS